MLFCDHCNTKISRKWNFCPKCGNKLARGFNLNDLFNRQMDYFKKMLDITGYDITIQPESENTFVVNISHSVQDGFSPPKTEEPNHYKQTKKIEQMKLPKKVSEPEISLKRRAGKLLFEVDLPGINDEKDVELTRMDNSIELRARKGNMGYFKILKIPNKYRLVEKRMSNGMLILEFLLN